MVKKIAAGVVLCILISFSIVQAMEERQKDSQPGLKVGVKAPDFTVATLEGDQASLSDFKGKKVIINFWATWCGPCREEMPDMQAFYAAGNDEVEILAINVDPQNDVKGFVEEFNVTFPVLLDTEKEVADNYKIMAYPTTYFIDEKGIIAKKHIGQITLEDLDKEMANM